MLGQILFSHIKEFIWEQVSDLSEREKNDGFTRIYSACKKKGLLCVFFVLSWVGYLLFLSFQIKTAIPALKQHSNSKSVGGK